MRIVDVKAYVIEEPVRRRRHWAHGLPPDPAVNELCWLQVVTDEGFDGWALSDHGHIVADVTRRCLVDAVKGEDPLLKERLWRKIWDIDRAEELPIYALGLLDVALWDITGKVAGLPLYRLLGGARDRCPAYASTATWPTQEEYLTRAEQCLSIGYRAIKIHAWGDAKADARLALALRDHVGSEIDLMYDGSARFRYEEALRLGRALEQAQFLWYEEPMLEFNIWQYARLCRDLDIPVLVSRDRRRSPPQRRRLRRPQRHGHPAHQRRVQGRDHRRHAHRPPRRLVRDERRSARRGTAQHPPLLCDPQHALLRDVRRRGSRGGERRARRPVARRGRLRPPTRASRARLDRRSRRVGADGRAYRVTIERRDTNGSNLLMSGATPRLIVAEGNFPNIDIERETAGDRAIVEERSIVTPAAIRAATKDAHGLIVTIQPLGAEYFANLGSEVRVIGRAGIGLDNIDLERGKAPRHRRTERSGIRDGRGRHPRGGADVGTAPPHHRVRCGRTHRLVRLADAALRRRRSRRVDPRCRRLRPNRNGRHRTGSPPSSATSSVSTRWSPLGPRASAACRRWTTLLETSDIVSLHTPLTDTTHHLIGAAQLARMKRTGDPHQRLARVTDRRGESRRRPRGRHDRRGRSRRPRQSNHRLRRPGCCETPRTVITPHVAWYSTSSERRVRVDALEGVLACLAGQPLPAAHYAVPPPDAAWTTRGPGSPRGQGCRRSRP